MADKNDLVRFTGGDPFGVARDPNLTVHLANAARIRFFRRNDRKAFEEWGNVLLEARHLLERLQEDEYEAWLQEQLAWYWGVRAYRLDLPKHEIDGLAEASFGEFVDSGRILEQVEILRHTMPG